MEIIHTTLTSGFFSLQGWEGEDTEWRAQDCCLLYPHWYQIDQNHVLQYLGKTSLEELGREGREVLLKTDQIIPDLEALLNLEPGQQLKGNNITFGLIVVTEFAKAAADRPFSDGEYVYMGKHLYKVKNEGLLYHLGAARVDTQQRFTKDFKRLTGKDISSARVVRTY